MLLWRLAWRNIWRNKMRSGVIMLSVSIGLFAGIAVLALQKGMLRARVRTVIDRELGHLQLHHPEFKNDYNPLFTIPGPENISGRLEQTDGIRAFARRSVVQGMLATTTGSFGVQVTGINLPEENEVSHLDGKIVEGGLFDGNRSNQVILSRKLCDKLQLQLKNKVVLTFTDKTNTISAGAFRVCGIYQTINTPLDERTVFVQQADLNAMLGPGYSCHEIAVVLTRDETVEAVQRRLQELFPALLVENWRELSPETALMLTSVNQYTYIIIIIIMLALAFGIINTMLMAVLERTREIGMLTALGLSKLRIFALVLYETFLLTLAGAPLGIISAWAASTYFGRHGIDISSVSREAMSSFGFESVIYPVFPLGQLTGVLTIVVATAWLAALFPAIKALRLKPVEALRK